jgi:hypothetical protein
MTKTNQIAIKRYGMTENQIREQYLESVSAKLGGLELVVAGILSDCQELTAMGRSEDVRQQLNVAKFILFEMKWPDN